MRHSPESADRAVKVCSWIGEEATMSKAPVETVRSVRICHSADVPRRRLLGLKIGGGDV
ncbi:putative E3 ubiquitin-protein ligase LUL4 [Iris pallida]|uniref:E3 ubiquitin-protein ligase LUL4 n=1 Tax=Iris pallida TaxID=29817 RepID=A0AAX6HTM9_IRIPA|nr:putative E3 ubiquitin-protein ligase LUL4 [Iris pallida]